MSEEMQTGEVPAAALPFGFRGIPALYTSPTRTNPTSEDGAYDLGTSRLHTVTATTLTGSIVPPLPYRVKVTKGSVNTSPVFLGEPGLRERADARFYWGVINSSICSPFSLILLFIKTNVQIKVSNNFFSIPIKDSIEAFCNR